MQAFFCLRFFPFCNVMNKHFSPHRLIDAYVPDFHFFLVWLVYTQMKEFDVFFFDLNLKHLCSSW